jgi:hypothetical protein
MSSYLTEFIFKKIPKTLLYLDGAPLNLSNEFSLFHNKNWFRKELTRLQLVFKNHINQTLTASGIRDTYLKKEYGENFLILILTTNEMIKKANQIVETANALEINLGCFYIESRSEHLLLIAKDKKGLVSGIDYLEDILTQILGDYLKKKNFDEYIQLRQFSLSNF